MTPRLQLLTKLLAESPNDSFLIFAIAKDYEGVGQTAEAIGFYQKLRENDPDYVGLYYHLGKLFEKSGQIENAVEVFDAGILVARKLKDRHAESELAGARLEIDID